MGIANTTNAADFGFRADRAVVVGRAMVVHTSLRRLYHLQDWLKAKASRFLAACRSILEPLPQPVPCAVTIGTTDTRRLSQWSPRQSISAVR